MDSKNNLQNSHKGFTLIELVVTLFIISVIVGFALPKIGDQIYSSDLKRSVRRLKAVLFMARSLATSDRIPRRIICDIPKSEIRIERVIREDGEYGIIESYEKENSALIRVYQFPEGVKIEDVITGTGEKKGEGEAYFRINPNGMISGDRIHLAKDEKQFTLVINRLTGGITIEEGYIEEYKIEAPQG
jgi:prepilin-type N-terminal cleavage/methylation domain-containing protein